MEEVEKVEDSQNRTATGQTKPSVSDSQLRQRASKTHQDYWKTRLKRRSYVDRQGVRAEVPEYQVRIFHLGRESWFNTGSANQSAAAIKARDIWVYLAANGWDSTLAKFKPEPEAKLQVCTLGEFLAEAARIGHLKPKTLANYSVKLRKLVADIAGANKGLKKKQARARYDYASGGRKAWVEQIENRRLDLLTHDSLVSWKNGYVAKAGADMAKRKSAERTSASILRCTRALFNPELTRLMKLTLPTNPFENLSIKDPGPQRYQSKVNPAWLLVCAAQELKPKKPLRQAYLALSLALWAGLRRKEADLLTWKQVDLEEGLIHIRRTEHFEPKTEESQRSIDIPAAAVEVLRHFKKGCTSEFVMEGNEPHPTATYDYYRADHTWRTLIEWLKGKGITDVKAIHSLRKESGSLIAASFGIEAARQHLGHRDISTTSAHYVGKKMRFEVKLDADEAKLRAVE